MPPERRQMISWTSGRENSPMEEARMEEECLRRRSRSFMEAAEVMDVMVRWGLLVFRYC